jgi:hypothetical protein
MKQSEKAMMAEAKKQERIWRAESDLRQLIEARKIESDPDRMKAVVERRDAMLADLEKIKTE